MKKITAISVLIIAAIISYAVYKSDSDLSRTIQNKVAKTFGVRPADVLSEILDEPEAVQTGRYSSPGTPGSVEQDETVAVQREPGPTPDAQQYGSAPVPEMHQSPGKRETLESGIANLEFRDDVMVKEGMDSPALKTPLPDDEKPGDSVTEVTSLEFYEDALEAEEARSPESEYIISDAVPEKPVSDNASGDSPRNVQEDSAPPSAKDAPVPEKETAVADMELIEKEKIDAGDILEVEPGLPVPEKSAGVIDKTAALSLPDKSPAEEITRPEEVRPELAQPSEEERIQETVDKGPDKGPEPESIPDIAREVREGMVSEESTDIAESGTDPVLPPDNLEEKILGSETLIPAPPHSNEWTAFKQEEVDEEAEKQNGAERAVARSRMLAELGESVALLPFDNLSESSEALEAVMPIIRHKLENRGFTLMYEEVLDDFLCDERLKRTGYISLPIARKGRDTLNIKTFIAGSIVTYADGDNPRVGILARAVDSSSGNILWADYASFSGEDFTGILGLGKIKDIKKLVGKTVDSLVESMTPAHLEIGSAPAYRVAVMPFKNNTSYHGAGMIATYMFMVELFKNERFDPAEFGDVRRMVVGYRIREKGDLEYSNINAFSEHLDTGAVLIGTVDHYLNGKSAGRPPRVGITVRLLDTKSKKILWYSTREIHGEEDIIAFDWGRIRTADRVAYKVVSNLLENMDNSNWNGFDK